LGRHADGIMIIVVHYAIWILVCNTNIQNETHRQRQRECAGETRDAVTRTGSKKQTNDNKHVTRKRCYTKTRNSKHGELDENLRPRRGRRGGKQMIGRKESIIFS